MIKNLCITVVTICLISSGLAFADIETAKKEGKTDSEIVEIQKTLDGDVSKDTDATSSEIEENNQETIKSDDLTEKKEDKNKS